jgi:hypothetical protein
MRRVAVNSTGRWRSSKGGREFHGPVEIGRELHGQVEIGRELHGQAKIGRELHGPVEIFEWWP